MNDKSIDDPCRRVRQYRDADEAEVVALWHRSGVAAYTYLAVRFGTSPPPESAPDVEYHWRPQLRESDRPATRARQVIYGAI
jgi:hypothetical protein